MQKADRSAVLLWKQPCGLQRLGGNAGVQDVRALRFTNGYYEQLDPPSSTSVCPVMKPAFVHIHTAASATSVAVAMRPRG